MAGYPDYSRPASEYTVVVYDFDADEYPARPDATVVRWIGPTEPPAWEGYDEWREVAAPDTVPGAPTSVTATAGDAQATVEWVAPASDGGAAITGYRVTPFIAGVGQTPTTVGNVLTTTITGLSNGTAYTFKVAAINSVGTGADSTASNEVTPAAPTGPQLVQTKINVVLGTTTTKAVTLDATPTEGNLLIAYIGTGSNYSSITPPSGFTAAATEVYGASDNVLAGIYYKVAGAAESATVEFSFGNSNSVAGLVVEEWSGIATSSPLDQTDTTDPGAVGTSLSLGPTATASQAEILAVAFVTTTDQTATFSSSLTGGFTKAADVDDPSFIVAHLVDTDGDNDTYSTDVTWSVSLRCAGIMATFKAA